MIAARLIFAYLRDRPLSAFLFALLTAIGVAAAAALTLFAAQSEARLTRDARHIDLVVGHKGSPLQLVLSAVFHADVPTGNLPYAEAERLQRDRRVLAAVPIAMGDSVRGVRIIGAPNALFDLYDARITRGRAPQAPFEAALGAQAARQLGLDVGATFVGAHGLGDGGGAHDAHPYRVVGVLSETGAALDRLAVTPHESVWTLHPPATAGATLQVEHHDHAHADDAAPLRDPQSETTAILVRTRSPLFALSLKQEINAATPYMAARPAEETSRFFALIGQGAAALQAFAALLIAAAALATFATLLTALRAQRGDIALLRVMGATRLTVFAVLLGQGLAIAAFGALIGLALGHGAIEIFARVSPQAQGFGLTGFAFAPEEWIILAGALVAGALAALAPALAAYRTDIARTLSEAA
ncbi:MAG: ABC transporter permease [Hyphomonadaceae bacterium]|nr:ABC transporter permease [Hyphomonadaceae bacterium]